MTARSERSDRMSGRPEGGRPLSRVVDDGVERQMTERDELLGNLRASGSTLMEVWEP